MIRHLPLVLLLALSLQASCQRPAKSTNTKSSDQPTDRAVGGSCECCDAWRDGLPLELDWQTTISPADEPGVPLSISGTIYQKDGKTPAKDIILYVYQTDAKGLYSNGPSFTECTRRHGHLRGWIKTGSDGRYKFKTIRPASYPNTSIEQHIHPIVKEPGLAPYWIDEFLFADDPNLTDKVRSRQHGRGGLGILTLQQDNNGVWIGERDIILGENVEDY